MTLPPIYKYLDVQGAKLTLGNKTFKHAKPSDFNDTEDLTIKSIFPEETELALKRLENCFTDVAPSAPQRSAHVQIADEGEASGDSAHVVIYREKRPPLYDDTLEFVAESLFGNQEACLNAMIEKIVYAKTLEWEYESEYRLVIAMRQGEEPWNTDSYHREEITELYLGLAMEKGDRDNICNSARAVNQDIAIFGAKRNADGKLRFDRV
jgi:hypothetical protein